MTGAHHEWVRPSALLAALGASLVLAPAGSAAPAATRIVTFSNVSAGSSAQLLEREGLRRSVALGSGSFLVRGEPWRMRRLRRLRGVLAVERNRALRVAERPAELDLNSEYLWFLENKGDDGGTAGDDIGAVAAWESIGYGNGVVVATIDTGIDPSHRDLGSQLWINPDEIPGNGRDDDNDGIVDDVYGANFANRMGSGKPVSGTPTDDEGHGTAVASLIVGAANGTGTIGVAPGARVMAVKAMDRNGIGTDAQVIAATNYALDHGAKIINMSIGFGRGVLISSTALRKTIVRAATLGALVVAAAGNDGTDNDTNPVYPASFRLPNLVSVAASTRNDALASFSNYGARSVDIAAPGSQVLVAKRGDRFGYGDGTSFSAPLVAGAAALLRSQDPALSPAALRQALIDGAKPVPALQGKVTGAGRLDLLGALARLPADRVAPDAPQLRAPVIGKGRHRGGTRKVSLSWSGARDDSGQTAFTLVVDGSPAASVPASALGAGSAHLKLRAGWHTVSVIALDPSGNESLSTSRRLRVR